MHTYVVKRARNVSISCDIIRGGTFDGWKEFCFSSRFTRETNRSFKINALEFIDFKGLVAQLRESFLRIELSEMSNCNLVLLIIAQFKGKKLINSIKKACCSVLLSLNDLFFRKVFQDFKIILLKLKKITNFDNFSLLLSFAQF